MAGALKKKLGLTITSEKDEQEAACTAWPDHRH